ncbi:methyltransferase domain-containing protein [Nonomuraea sp. NPDC046802]|uniref:class I SAM-dependent methyltransferase n=1 Tax=Nonomuraea sp. NPDC046802 TaxID=3154919 RepID=UPI0033EB5FE9
MDASVSSTPADNTVDIALQALFDAPSASVHAAFRQLDAAFRRPPKDDAPPQHADAASTAFAQGAASATATDAGHAAVPVLASALKTALATDARADRLQHLVMLLALLAGTDAHDAVRAELEVVLGLFGEAARDRRLAAALLYFAGLFPEDRDRVMAASSALELSQDDRSRLVRSLAEKRTEDHALGREWPSPAMWAVTEAELETDRKNWLVFMSEHDINALWEADTRKIRDYSALKAIALLDTPLRPYRAEPDALEPEQSDAAAPATADTASAVDRLAPVSTLLTCPDCRGAISLAGDGAHCGSCGKDFPATGDWLDLSSEAGQSIEAMIISDPTQALRYERGLRPAFLRAMGRDFDGLLTVEQEIGFLERNLGVVTGPVLDLAAGAGRFTRVIAQAAPGRVIPLDLSTSMLTALQSTSPKLPAIRGSALRLPIADASLGAVNCWNALQTLPEQEKVIGEVSRCLVDGGTFTLFTFEQSTDPLYREFQTRHEKDLRVELQSRETLIRWLAEAGFTICEEHRLNGYLLLAATRNNR